MRDSVDKAGSVRALGRFAFIAALALAALGLVSIACGEEDERTTVGPAVEPEASVPAVPTAFSASSVEDAEPTATLPATSTQDVADCAVLPVEHCQGGTVINLTANGVAQVYVGLAVSPGVAIIAPTTGQLAKTKECTFSGFGAQLSNAELSNATLIKGDVLFRDMVYQSVQAGESIATVGDRGFSNFSGFNLIVTINRRSPTGPVPDVELLRRQFPDAFSRPAIDGGNLVRGPVNDPQCFVYGTAPP